jgi:DNA-binding NtrC family response regulator
VPPIPHEFRTARAAALAEFERHYAEALLRKHGGNVTHAAREAQQDRRAFGRILKKYQINRRAL